MRRSRMPFLVSLCFLVQGCGASSTGSAPPGGPPQVPPASTQQWVAQFGTGTVPAGGLPGDLMSALVSSPNGGVYVAGYTLGAFSGFPANPVHVAEPYLLRFSADGQQQWLRQFSTGAGDFIESAASDSSGNVFLCGTTMGAFGGFTNPSGMSQAMLVKYDSDGTRIWVQQFAVGGRGATISAAALSPSGQLFVAGVQMQTSATHGQNIFAAAIDSTNGSILWQQIFGVDSTDNVDAIAADGSGGLYLSGTTSGPFPGGISQEPQPFVVRLAASDGHPTWIQSFADLRTTYHLVLASLTIGQDGSVVVGGAQSSDYVAVGQSAAPNAKALLLKLSASSGDIMWQRTYATGAGDQISSVRILGDGTIYAAGSTNGVFSTRFSQPRQDLFLLKCKPDGEPVWVQQFGTGPIVNTTIPFGLHLAVNATNDVFVGGATQGIYPGSSNPFSAVEGFIIKFGP